MQVGSRSFTTGSRFGHPGHHIHLSWEGDEVLVRPGPCHGGTRRLLVGLYFGSEDANENDLPSLCILMMRYGSKGQVSRGDEAGTDSISVTQNNRWQGGYLTAPLLIGTRREQ